MKTRRFVDMMLILFFSLPVQSEVFKCRTALGKTIYQPEPCSPAAKQSVIEVKEMTPEETENAKAKLRDWQDQQAVQEANKLAAEKEQQQKAEQQQLEDLQRRAQEHQTIESQRPQGINRRFGYLPSP